MSQSIQELLLLIVAGLFGISLGFLLRGLWRNRSAAAAQIHAYARAGKLPSRLRRKPEYYLRKGRQSAGLLAVLGFGTYVATWLASAALPVPAATDIPWYALATLLACIAGLFPAVMGSLTVVSIVCLRLSAMWSLEPWTQIADPAQSLPLELEIIPQLSGPVSEAASLPIIQVETLSIPILYRFAADPLAYRSYHSNLPADNPASSGSAIRRLLAPIFLALPGIRQHKATLSPAGALEAGDVAIVLIGSNQIETRVPLVKGRY